MPLLNVSVHHQTQENLTAARHTYDLCWLDKTIVNLDYQQGGLGSASCGPGPLPQYQIEPDEKRFRIRLRPVCLESDDPMRLAALRLP